jgi:SNF2 family DNA or RNA helicase
MVIIDELSSFKSPSAKRFRALKKVRHKIKRIVGLTGTPAPNGKPVLIYYGFKHERDRIRERFDAGDINTSEDIARWNRGEMKIALCHPASAGHGLNLQEGGCTIIWFSITWSLELYQQANDRLWRQGQKNTVVIHHILAKDTIDQRVMMALDNKDTGQKALIEAVKARMENLKNGG